MLPYKLRDAKIAYVKSRLDRDSFGIIMSFLDNSREEKIRQIGKKMLLNNDFKSQYIFRVYYPSVDKRFMMCCDNFLMFDSDYIVVDLILNNIRRDVSYTNGLNYMIREKWIEYSKKETIRLLNI